MLSTLQLLLNPQHFLHRNLQLFLRRDEAPYPYGPVSWARLRLQLRLRLRLKRRLALSLQRCELRA